MKRTFSSHLDEPVANAVKRISAERDWTTSKTINNLLKGSPEIRRHLRKKRVHKPRRPARLALLPKHDTSNAPAPSETVKSG